MDTTVPVLAANLQCLDQAVDLLARLPESAFARREAQHAKTIGPHLRHVLDHYSSFLHGLDSFRIDYDAREREVRLETEIDYATARLREDQAVLVGRDPGSAREGVDRREIADPAGLGDAGREPGRASAPFIAVEEEMEPFTGGEPGSGAHASAERRGSQLDRDTTAS